MGILLSLVAILVGFWVLCSLVIIFSAYIDSVSTGFLAIKEARAFTDKIVCTASLGITLLLPFVVISGIFFLFII